MKMVMAIVRADDAPDIKEALVCAGHWVARIATTGGFLCPENATLLIVVADRMVNHVFRVLQRTGRQRTIQTGLPLGVPWAEDAGLSQVEVGGATVFVLDVEQFERC